ncbi:MAG: triose-phosphate isomerase, partial [Sedimentibacter sp.]
INEMAAFIRTSIGEIYDIELSEKIIIQYGGSVKSENANEILSLPDIDGALVGGASLKADEFIKIINYEK